MIAAFDYASPSVFESDRDRALLGLSANARRPVRFQGRVTRNVPLLRFTLRAFGEAIWSEDSWAEQGQFEGRVLDPVITDRARTLGSRDTAPGDDLVARVLGQLADHRHASVRDLAEALGEPPDQVWRACERLCRQGRSMYDVESRSFRELFEEPVDEARLFPPDERLERARALLPRGAVSAVRCERQETRKTRKLKTPDGPVTREIVHRDWRITGAVGRESATEIVVGDLGRILFGTCGCPFFQENLLGKGPCEHMIALLHASADDRKDLPTSFPVADPAK